MSQFYKSVSFPKAINKTSKSKTLKLAFNKSDVEMINIIKDLDSSQMRSLLNVKSYEDLEDLAKHENRSLNNTCVLLIKDNCSKYNIKNKDQLEFFFAEQNSKIRFTSSSGTFKNNKNKEIFNWYPYVEGFSFDFVEEILKHIVREPKLIYDPFAGTGTTILVSSLKKIDSAFSEINPLMKFIIETKVKSLIQYKYIIKNNLSQIDKLLSDLNNSNIDALCLDNKQQRLLEKGYFTKDILTQLTFIKRKIQTTNFPAIINDLLLLALAAIITKESNMIRRADLRYKKGKEFNEIDPDVIGLFINKTNNILTDLKHYENGGFSTTKLISNNAKEVDIRYNNAFDLIITSPPYVNGTNYFRNTKLELLFLDFIENEDELKKFRTEAITSGINNVSKRKVLSEKLSYLSPIVDELKKEQYDPRIPKLVEYYFSDMKTVFNNIHNIITDNGDFFIDIGDSKFSNVHVPTDELFEKIANGIGFELIDKNKIRNRFSKDGTLLGQWLLHFKKKKNYSRKNGQYKINRYQFLQINNREQTAAKLLINNWEKFRDNIPYRYQPYSKRNWGHGLHSLCSYQGKLKPSIAHFLVKYFTSEGMKILDPLSGVGTIPFETRLSNRVAYGNDLSLVAYANTLAKIGYFSNEECINYVDDLEQFIKSNVPTEDEIASIDINFNKNIMDYYHEDTFKEILSARLFFKSRKISKASEAVVFAIILHILHGNRPYALSRTSHPITPFAPQGEFIYKNLIQKLKEKLIRVIKDINQLQHNAGFALLGDYSELVNKIETKSIDSIITSPPFFDSTRFYMANWIRMWFAGWDKNDFKDCKDNFLETKQVKNIDIYDDFFRICDNLLKPDGSIIMHLGFSKKANMAELLIPFAEKYFNIVGYFNENVHNNENFGISDQGTVKRHQYLFITKT